MRKETDADQIDFNKKILHMSWHPFEDSIAIAATNNVSPFNCTCFQQLHSLTLSSFSSSLHCEDIIRIVSSRSRHAQIEAFPHAFLAIHFFSSLPSLGISLLGVVRSKGLGGSEMVGSG
jgi:hypothetical protein